MADFRKLLPALALFALIAMLSVPAAAQNQAFTCVNNAGVPPTVRAEGITELVGDLVLNCSGSAGVVPASGITANVQIFLNTNVTSRITDTTNNKLEALMILNEGTTGVQYIQGQLAGANSVVWLGVPVLGAGSTSSIIRITNVRANASGVTSINPSLPSSLIPAQIVEFISITGSTSVPVNNPQQIVAFAQQGLVSSVTAVNYKQCITSDSGLGEGNDATISFAEGFASSFKPAYNIDGTEVAGVLVGRGGLLSTPALSNPGQAYGDESGFIWPTVAGVGTASSGTRLQAVFQNIPAGATVVVPNQLIGGAAIAQLEDTTGSGTTSLTATGTTATAVWTVTVANPFSPETLAGPVYITYTSNPGAGIPSLSPPAMTASLSFGNLSTVTTASSTDAIPRFIDTSSAKTIVTVNACVTNLLYPFVTTAAGFDTGLAVANTGVDVDGLTTSSPGQSGSCTLYMFGPGAPTTPPVTPSVAAGTVFAFSVYAGAPPAIPGLPDWTGYVIARCAFQYGHGYAFISDLGASKLAQGYLALVIPDRGGDRPVDNITTAGPGTGEILSQ